MSLLEVKNLKVEFKQDDSFVTAVDEISFKVKESEILGIVGESGSGKSVTSFSILRLLPINQSRISGEVLFEGKDILKLDNDQLADFRGNDIAMIFQEPMTALNPVHTIKSQLEESIKLHNKLSDQEVENKAIGLLKEVQIADPSRILKAYPHQLSGGMKQRILIAIALSCNPKLLIADEPTTALDVTTQVQILKLLKNLQETRKMAIIFISHDLGVISQLCDKIAVMYAGRIVEFATKKILFTKAKHAYTNALLKTSLSIDTPVKSKLKVIEGVVPLLKDLVIGCRFGARSNFDHEDSSYKTKLAIREFNEDHWIEWCPCCQKHLSKELL